MEGCGTSSGLDVLTRKWGATQVSPDAVVVQEIGVLLRENVYKTTFISKKRIILPLFYIYAHIFCLLQNHLQMKVSLSSWSIHPQIVLNS